jgi:hypothetical protein
VPRFLPGPEFEKAVEICQRLVDLPTLEIRAAAAIVDLRGLRLQGEDPREIGGGLGVVVLALVEPGAYQVRVGVLWIARDCLVRKGERLNGHAAGLRLRRLLEQLLHGVSLRGRRRKTD